MKKKGSKLKVVKFHAINPLLSYVPGYHYEKVCRDVSTFEGCDITAEKAHFWYVDKFSKENHLNYVGICKYSGIFIVSVKTATVSENIHLTTCLLRRASVWLNYFSYN